MYVTNIYIYNWRLNSGSLSGDKLRALQITEIGENIQIWSLNQCIWVLDLEMMNLLTCKGTES